MTGRSAMPPAGQTAAANVAVVGCGYWGSNLVRNYQALGALAAVADTDPKAAAEQSTRAGVPALTFAEVLADPEIAGIVIAAPAELHAPLALEALDAKKHVFVEKPLALTVDDAERVIERAAAADRILMVGHLLHYHPAFLRLQEVVREGILGRLQYLYSNRLNLGKIRREENVFWSFAPHDLSMILALVGELPDQVQAIGLSYLHRVVADVTTTHLSFASGVNAHVFVSWLHPFKEQKLVVVGDAGMAVFDDGRPWAEKLTVYPHRITWVDGVPTPAKADGERLALDEAEPLALECRHFLECMVDGRRPRTDGDEGLRVLRVLEVAERSMQRGQIIALPGRGARDQRPPAASRDKQPPDVVVHESSYVDEGCTIGPGTRIWHFCHVMAGSRIGRDCIIGQNVMIGPEVTVGDGCKIQNNVSLYKGVTLEDGVFCGPSCVFTNVLNARAGIERKNEFRDTRVGRGATIGANATIVCGHEIGAYAFVAAGAVVTRDVPPHALVAGVPARRIGWVSHTGERLGTDLVCPRTGRRYNQLPGERLVEVDAVDRAVVGNG